LVLWLTSTHGIGFADGGVATWVDQSGSGYVAKQSIIEARPKLVTVLALNQDMLEFDGVDDFLALDDGFADFSQGLTAFIVSVAMDDRACASLLHLSNDPEVQEIDIGRQGGSIHYEVAEAAGTGPLNAFALNQTIVLSVIHQAAPSADLRINSVYMTSGPLALPEVVPRQNNFIGRSLYSGCELFKGRIGEILLYDYPFTLDERTQMQDYLQAKWRYEPAVKPKPLPDEVATK
jgi:hypothetical protein